MTQRHWGQRLSLCCHHIPHLLLGLGLPLARVRSTPAAQMFVGAPRQRQRLLQQWSMACATVVRGPTAAAWLPLDADGMVAMGQGAVARV